MPADQSGGFQKERNGRWTARWYEPDPTSETSPPAQRRRSKGGFASKSEARKWVKTTLEEVEGLRSGNLIPVSHRPQTVNALLDLFIEKARPELDSATLRTDKSALKHARSTFGDRHPDSLNRLELEDWRAAISPGSRHRAFRIFRQALAWGMARSLVTRDASVGIKNPKRKRHERRDVLPFESWADVEKVADELAPRFRVIPFLAVGCGLRPEELFGLHRSDVDRTNGVLRVNRRYTGGLLKEGGKTDGSVRAIPLRGKVIDAIDQMPKRIDTQILVPAVRGGYIDIERFRHREWTPALRAAGIEHRRIYDCRHTFATWAIESGVHLWHLATIMGTSVVQLEDTYARWLKRTDDQIRTAFEDFDSREATG